MPIRIPDGLPAKADLLKEKIYTIDELRASTQDIRPLKILLLNLMPKKEETELQILRLLGNSPLQVDIDFCRLASHDSKTTPRSHLTKFYMTFDEIQAEFYDGCIITGAPVEHLDFSEVDYYGELEEFFDWTKSHVFSTIHLCWGAQAGLYHHYDIAKLSLDEKLFGVYPVNIDFKGHPIIRGFDDYYYVPVSRHSCSDAGAIYAEPGLDVLTCSFDFGPEIVARPDNRQIFIMGHLEYDRETLGNEYRRDLSEGKWIQQPYNYFPSGNTGLEPAFVWRSHANLLYYNWLNFVYQETPYIIEAIADLKLN